MKKRYPELYETILNAWNKRSLSKKTMTFLFLAEISSLQQLTLLLIDPTRCRTAAASNSLTLFNDIIYFHT